jgi:Protein of unknown function (DUF3105)
MVSPTKSTKLKAAQAKSGAAKRSQLLWYLWGGVGALIVAGIIGFNIFRESQKPGQKFANQGNIHLDLGKDHPAYNSNPPTSGWHTPGLASWGSYDVISPDEPFIHNLEDGGVILWYNMGTPEENEKQIVALEAVSKGYRDIVIAPREDLPAPYVLTAWTRLQSFEAIDEAGMTAFIKAFHGLDHHVAGTG